MPKRIVPLSDMKILKAKPRPANYSLFDGGGLFILVTPTGGKLWRFKYRFDNKQKLLALGSYPEVSLQDARKKREEARAQLAKGTDPREVQKDQKKQTDNDNGEIPECDTFEGVARKWYKKNSTPVPQGKSGKKQANWTQKYSTKVIQCLENNIFPLVTKKKPMIELKSADILKVMKFAEDRGVIDTAHRIKGLCGQIFRFGITEGKAERDVTLDLRGSLIKVQKTHFPAITEPTEAGALMRAIYSYKGTFIVQNALKLAPLFFVRPIELRTGEWKEVNLKNALWIIPREKMKMRKISENDHVVPLCTQAIEIMRELYRLTGSGRYIFPSAVGSDRPMSENAILYALRRMGYDESEMTGHGFRAMARTMLDEQLHIRVDYIEHQLAHAVTDPNGRAYNRTAHLEGRRIMMQQWADYLDELRSSGEVVKFKIE